MLRVQGITGDRARPAGTPEAGTPEADTTAAPSNVEIVQDFADPYLELLRLLREAAEIEHALMVQYLYAAFSVKPEYAQLQGSGSVASAQDLTGVAIQEMHHLDAVNRLLVGLGATPCLVRQDFPYEPDIYPFPFNLERLGPLSLAKYAWTEAPGTALARDPAADADTRNFLDRLYATLGEGVRPNHLGSVYHTMITRLREVADAPPGRFPDLAFWVEKLTMIKDEGEGDHFRFFRSVFLGTHPAFPPDLEVWSLDPADPRYPSFAVPTNPTALRTGDPDDPERIGDGAARRKAWLGNLHYWTILMLLDLSYRYGLSTSGLAVRHMVKALRVLGTDLAASGHGLPFDPLSMGYAPGVDQAGSLEVLRRLAAETDRVAGELAGQGLLPDGYAADLGRVTQQRLAEFPG